MQHTPNITTIYSIRFVQSSIITTYEGGQKKLQCDSILVAPTTKLIQLQFEHRNIILWTYSGLQGDVGNMTHILMLIIGLVQCFFSIFWFH
jgi:hypothetical protein